MAHKILGGWSLDGVCIYTSGSNFSIDAGTVYAGAGPGGGSQYWVQNGPLRVTAADPNFYLLPTPAASSARRNHQPPARPRHVLRVMS
jgi:hypothetical protein